MKLNEKILADVFQSNMILPLNKDLKLGGVIEADQKVNIHFNDEYFQTESDKNGQWQITIPAVNDPNMIATISVKTKYHEQTIKNIRFGIVYLLSGQSNIEYRLKDEKHFAEIKNKLRKHQFKDLYYYNVPQVDYIDPKTKEVKPKDLHLERWHEVNEHNCGTMSAIGFYMIEEIQKEGIKGPIAIVDCFKGGTSASVWIKKDDLARDAELKEKFLNKYHQEIANKTWIDFNHETEIYNRKVEQHNKDLAKYLKMHPDTSLSTAKNIVGHTPWPPPSRPDLFTRPCGLYETMLSQVKDGVFNGLIWYQGEDDTDRARQYHKLLPLLIQTWRRKLQDPSLPVKIIQLPGYADYPKGSGALIRQVQLDTARKMPEVDLVSFVDGGEEHNIHPTNKEIMGERLGKICATNNYAGTPYVDYVEYKKDKLILHVVRSNHLKLKAKTIVDTIVLNKRKQIEIANSNIHKDCIVIQLPARPSEISYGYSNFPENIGLYNELDYPVSPFKFRL